MAKENLIFYDYTTELYGFNESCLIGNGRLGAAVYGKTVVDKISFNNETVWSGKPKAYTSDTAYEAYKKSIECIENNDFEGAEEVLMRDFNGDWSEAYLPLCTLYNVCQRGKTKNYKRILDMEHGVVSVEYDKNSTHFERIYFMSKKYDCFVCEYKSDKKENYDFFLDSKLSFSVQLKENTIIMNGECPSKMYPASHIEGTPMSWDGGIRFTNIFKFITDGVLTQKDGHMIIFDATYVRVFMYSETSFIDYKTEPTKDCYSECLMQAQQTEDFDKILGEHREYFKKTYNKTELQCNAPSNSDTDIKKRISEDSHIVSKTVMYYNFAKYLLISSSEKGTMATNLQGIWNEEMPPIWSSSYTFNINTQMNYWPVLSSGYKEFYEPLIEMIKELSESGKNTAKNLYNADGWVLHQISDIWRMTNASGGLYTPDSCCYSFWSLGSGWMVRQLWEYYEYTMDKDYLRYTAYPIIKEAVKFYMSVLKEYNGGWILTPSTSPENHFYYKGEIYSVSRYTAMSQAIIKDAMLITKKCCQILNIDLEFENRVKAYCDNLVMFDIGREGQLLEWNEEYEEVDPHYYHVSPLYALYPSNLINKDGDKKLYDAAVNLLKRRTILNGAWPNAWQWNLYDKIGDKDSVLKIIKKCVNRKDRHALLDVSVPFQVDCIFGNMSGIQNMFMQSHEIGKIGILQALPDEFENGHFKGLLAKGNICVNLKWDKSFVKIELQSPITQKVSLEVKNAHNIEVELIKDEKKEILINF